MEQIELAKTDWQQPDEDIVQLAQYHTEYLLLPIDKNHEKWKLLQKKNIITILHEDNTALLARIN